MEEYMYLNDQLAELLPENSISFTDMLGQIIRGEEVLSPLWLCNLVIETISNEIAEMKSLFIALLLLAVVTSVFYNFSGAFQNKQVSDISFYFAYLLLANILLKTFYLSLDIACNLIDTLVHFTEVLMPAYYITVAASSAITTASSFYQLTLIAIYVVESAFPGFIVPMISGYVFCSFISSLEQEDKLQPMLSLIYKFIEFLLKLALGMVTGFGVVKSMVNPAIDRLKTNSVQKIVSVIPGIGEVTESLSQVMLGSAILIKNGLGLTILICLIILCVGPVLKLLLLALVVQVSAAFMGIFSDKRSYRCTERVSKGCMLLLKSVICVIAMFFITIALVGMNT